MQPSRVFDSRIRTTPAAILAGVVSFRTRHAAAGRADDGGGFLGGLGITALGFRLLPIGGSLADCTTRRRDRCAPILLGLLLIQRHQLERDERLLAFVEVATLAGWMPRP